MRKPYSQWTEEQKRRHNERNKQWLKEHPRTNGQKAALAAYMRRYREEHGEDLRTQDKAQKKIAAALRHGHIIPNPCFFCGSTIKTQAHHPDYNQPYYIIWLCAACHKKLHVFLK